MKAPASQQRQRISLNLPPEIQQWLFSRARQDARPLADVAATLLEEALQQLEGLEGTRASAAQTAAADSPAAADH